MVSVLKGKFDRERDRVASFTRGDIVVYSRQKQSNSPGPRARDVSASAGGETYSYIVDKFWIVAEVGEQELKLLTRRGKEHTVDINDFRLKRPTFWQKLFLKYKFPSPAVLNQWEADSQDS